MYSLTGYLISREGGKNVSMSVEITLYSYDTEEEYMN